MPERTVIMGILNVTPDSFSDGGVLGSVDDAIARGIELRAEGADVVDVGGESTRPGAQRIPVQQELERVLPVIEGLRARGVSTSIDTMNAVTAREAVRAGAVLVNDVSGGLADPEMYRTIAELGVTYVAMHWRGHSTRMDALATYADVVAEVRGELRSRLAEMLVWGIDPRRVILDPGLGFAKTADHNWALLQRLDALQSLGHRVLVGTSRKRFLGAFLPDGAPPTKRDRVTAITSALAAQAGAWGVRVHDVKATKQALDVQHAWASGRAPAPETRAIPAQQPRSAG